MFRNSPFSHSHPFNHSGIFLFCFRFLLFSNILYTKRVPMQYSSVWMGQKWNLACFEYKVAYPITTGKRVH